MLRAARAAARRVEGALRRSGGARGSHVAVGWRVLKRRPESRALHAVGTAKALATASPSSASALAKAALAAPPAPAENCEALRRLFAGHGIARATELRVAVLRLCVAGERKARSLERDDPAPLHEPIGEGVLRGVKAAGTLWPEAPNDPDVAALLREALIGITPDQLHRQLASAHAAETAAATEALADTGVLPYGSFNRFRARVRDFRSALLVSSSPGHVLSSSVRAVRKLLADEVPPARVRELAALFARTAPFLDSDELAEARALFVVRGADAAADVAVAALHGREGLVPLAEVCASHALLFNERAQTGPRLVRSLERTTSKRLAAVFGRDDVGDAVMEFVPHLDHRRLAAAWARRDGGGAASEAAALADIRAALAITRAATPEEAAAMRAHKEDLLRKRRAARRGGLASGKDAAHDAREDAELDLIMASSGGSVASGARAAALEAAAERRRAAADAYATERVEEWEQRLARQLDHGQFSDFFTAFSEWFRAADGSPQRGRAAERMARAAAPLLDGSRRGGGSADEMLEALALMTPSDLRTRRLWDDQRGAHTFSAAFMRPDALRELHGTWEVDVELEEGEEAPAVAKDEPEPAPAPAAAAPPATGGRDPFERSSRMDRFDVFTEHDDAREVSAQFSQRYNATKVVVRNVPMHATVSELEFVFSQCGAVVGVEIFRDAVRPEMLSEVVRRKPDVQRMRKVYRDTPTSPVSAFVYMAEEDGARRALSAALRLFGVVMQGHVCVTVRPEDCVMLQIGGLKGVWQTLDELRFILSERFFGRLPGNGRLVAVHSETSLESFGVLGLTFDSHDSAEAAYWTMQQWVVAGRKIGVAWPWRLTRHPKK